MWLTRPAGALSTHDQRNDTDTRDTCTRAFRDELARIAHCSREPVEIKAVESADRRITRTKMLLLRLDQRDRATIEPTGHAVSENLMPGRVTTGAFGGGVGTV